MMTIEKIMAMCAQYNIPFTEFMTLMAFAFNEGTTTPIGGIHIGSPEEEFAMFLKAKIPDGYLSEMEDRLKLVLKQNGFTDLFR